MDSPLPVGPFKGFGHSRAFLTVRPERTSVSEYAAPNGRRQTLATFLVTSSIVVVAGFLGVTPTLALAGGFAILSAMLLAGYYLVARSEHLAVAWFSFAFAAVVFALERGGSPAGLRETGVKLLVIGLSFVLFWPLIEWAQSTGESLADRLS